MEFDCSDAIDFESICNHYQFSVQEFKDYRDTEKWLMCYYLFKQRNNGDTRDKNVIYIEWIKNNSENFRIMWVMIMRGIK